MPHPETIRIRDDVSLFQHVRAALSKQTDPSVKSDEELDHAVRQIVSRAVAPDGVVDIFAAAGLKKPDVSILSEEFLHEVRGMRRRNLAVELLERLLKGELATRKRKNVVQASTLVRRDAGADGPPLPEPRGRGGAGDRGADRPRPRDA